MKTLSLYQPWATLIVIGAKKFETRSWWTSYRGQLLIHASKKFTKADRRLMLGWPFCEYLQVPNEPTILPTGAIIGQVDLVGCMKAEDCPDVRHEHYFGDYSDGRFAWQLENPIKFDEPIPARGSLGLWEFPESALGHLAREAS